VKEKGSLGKLGVAIDEVGPDSSHLFGGKANNYALLRRTLPDANTPNAVAFSFDLWDEVMKLPVDSTARPGETTSLEEEIAHRLSPYRTYPPSDMRGMREALDGVRELVEDVSLTPSIEAGIRDVILGPGGLENPRFDPSRPMRFRSSTNMEDADTFTGAGLYDSFSGTLAVDLGQKEPGKGSDRPVSKAIRKVMASFYNDNAYQERLRHGVAEADVGMAILAHSSYPDEREKANGVATVSVDEWQHNVTMVSQVGADSITNPEPNAPLAEIVQVSAGRDGSSAYTILQQSSTHPKLKVGEQVMQYPTDYEQFGALFGKAAEAFIAERGLTPPVKLDIEFKKVAPAPGEPPGDKLLVKQIRAVPQVTGNVPTALIQETQKLEIDQGEFGDVFSNHLQKSRWTVTTDNRFLDGDDALNASPFTHVEVEYLEDGEIKKYSGPISAFPGYGQKGTQADGRAHLEDTWVNGLGQHTLSSDLSLSREHDFGPFAGIEDLQMLWGVKLAKPGWQIGQEWNAEPGQPAKNMPLEEVTAILKPPREPAGEVSDRWNFKATGKGLNGADVLIQPRYYYGSQPGSDIIGEKTASLAKWEGTTITGLTSQPFVLKGYFSQTMRPQHHNFSEEFLFEPRLEEGVSPEVLRELQAQDIQRIYIDGSQSIYVSGNDGKWRPMSITPQLL
jgi:hypothetical protein